MDIASIEVCLNSYSAREVSEKENILMEPQRNVEHFYSFGEANFYL